MRIARYSSIAALTALLGACAPGADQPVLAQYKPNGYRLGAGDQLRIITFGEPQLTGQFTVDDQGSISVPLMGSVQAAGTTPQQLGHALETGLMAKNVLRDASVSVQVLTYRPIFVLGEVAKPGEYAYQPGMTMLTAVAIAGGFTYRAVEGYASDVRTADGTVSRGNVTPDSFLAPGDVVKVYERHF